MIIMIIIGVSACIVIPHMCACGVECVDMYIYVCMYIYIYTYVYKVFCDSVPSYLHQFCIY